MSGPDAVIDVIGLEEWNPVVDWEKSRNVSARLEAVTKLISKLELEAEQSEIDQEEIANLASDLSWHISDIEEAREIIDDYEEVPHVIAARDAELESRLTPDEKEELEEQTIMYRLRNG